LGTASAADMAVKAAPPGAVATVYDWTGIYLGGSVGGVWDKPGNQYNAFNDTTNTFTGANSWIAGVHAVGMWQISHLVVGAEADYRWTSLDHSTICPNDTFTCTQNTPNMFTAGGRIGGAWGQWLLYADGGYAQSRLHASAFNTSTGELLEAAHANSDGWYAGVGIAYAVTPNIVLGAQYTHVVANEVMLTFPDPYINDARTASNRFDMIEFRADFKLWPWSSASSY
jgi:outer membrane immunogenic protein